MKKLLYRVMIVLLGGMNNTVSAGGEGETTKNTTLRDVKIKFATRSSFINGDCQDDRGFCLRIEIVIDSYTGGRASGYNGTGTLILNSDNRLTLNILSDDAEPANNNELFFVNGDIVLNQEICEALGINSCTIKKGKYSISYGQYEHGSVVLNVVTE
ncbi:MAG: hypothetical protein ACK45U_09060 [bacterium]